MAIQGEDSAQSGQARMRFVVLLFIGTFILRTLLAFLFREAPIVVIDESLYTNIARSLLWEGKLAYRGQPIDYPYLLYPLLLMPVYGLQSLLGLDVYRMVQVFGTLLICSSVFPVFLFARDFAKDESKALLAAGMAALMPDMLMGAYEMTECVIWPLALWMTFFAYRLYAGRGVRYGYLTAAFAGLMFFAKPGAIAMGAALLAVHIVIVALGNRKELLHAILPVVLLAGMLLLMFALYKALYPADSSLIGLYDKQTSNWRASDVLVAIEATFMMVFLFAFSCGGIFALVPFAFLKDYEERDRRFIFAYSCGLLAAIIGTAVFVVPYMWDSSLGTLPLHLRYCAMFVPAYFVFAIRAKRAKGKVQKSLYIALIVFIALCIFPGARVGFPKDDGSSIDSVMLSAFYTTPRLDGGLGGTLLTIFVIVWIVCVIYALTIGWNQRVIRMCASFFAVFLLYNNVCAYLHTNVPIDSTIGDDAREINAILEEKSPCLGVTQRMYNDIYSYWLESRLNRPMQQVTIDQMCASMASTGGVYEPFIPIDQSPNVGNGLTPDTETLILGKTIAEHLEVSDSVETYTTTNGHFTAAYITKGERWVDSMMYGMSEDILKAGVEGQIQFYDGRRNIDGHAVLHITAYGSGTLNVGGVSIPLSEEETTYDVTVPFGNGLISVTSDEDVVITRYSSDRAE